MKILKSMRDVRALAASGAGAGAVNAFNFRSPEEVKVFLDQIEHQAEELELPDPKVMGAVDRAVAKLLATASVVKSHREDAAVFRIDRHADIEEMQRKLREKQVDKKREKRNAAERKDLPINLEDFDAPSEREQKTLGLDIVRKLHEKLETLDAMELNIKQAFAGERVPLTAQITQVRKAVETKMRQALALLSKIAQKKVPKVFADAVDPTITEFLKRAAGRFKGKPEVKTYLFTKTDRAGTLYFVFQRFVILNGFRNDDESFTYPNYILVFTAAVTNQKKMTMHVTTLHHQRPPGTFKFGATFTDPQTSVRELDALLDADNIVDLLTKSKLPKNKTFSPQQFSTAKQYIKDVTVSDDVVRIVLKTSVPKSEAARQTVIEKVFRDVRTILGYGNSQSLKYRPIPQADKTVVLEFVLVPTANGGHKAALSEQQRSILETHFAFDEDDIEALTRVLRKGY